MKRFRFRLEAVEQVRRNDELIAMRSLATAQRALQREIQQKNNLVSLLAKTAEKRQALSGDVVTSASYAIHESLILGTKKRIIAAGYAIRRAKKAVEQALLILLAKRRALRAIEILREKAFENFKKERSRYEAKQLDDLQVMRAGHWGLGDSS
jgi:flagellar export protein FliJ